MNPTSTSPEEPRDEHNRSWIEAVGPADWPPPPQKECYDLVVLGAGTAGLVTAAGAAGLGARVALVEKHRMGGDCLNVGCVPSKSLLSSAHRAADVRSAGRYGIHGAESAHVDFAAVMERLRRIRAGIAPHDGARRFQGLGVDVFFGHARFVGDRHVEVDGRRLRYRRAVVATGARARLPDIPGLADCGALTNENVFNLTALPARMVVLGGGPIGCELAQAFARLGSQVTLVHNKSQILDREDPEAAAVVRSALESDGIRVLAEARVEGVSKSGDVTCLRIQGPGSSRWTLEAEALLVATGRAPNVEGLGLESVGVKWDPVRGVEVDDHLRTNNSRIYACGDVCLESKFTHVADFSARIVIQNALFALVPLGRRKVSSLVVPRVTYTDPEIAHVGLGFREIRTGTTPFDVFSVPFASVDRSITEDEPEGFARVWVARGTDRILGATLVGAGAGELVSELTLALRTGLGLSAIAATIHPYPTRSEVLRKLGDQYQRTRLTPRSRSLLQALLAIGRWRG